MSNVSKMNLFSSHDETSSQMQSIECEIASTGFSNEYIAQLKDLKEHEDTVLWNMGLAYPWFDGWDPTALQLELDSGKIVTCENAEEIRAYLRAGKIQVKGVEDQHTAALQLACAAYCKEFPNSYIALTFQDFWCFLSDMDLYKYDKLKEYTTDALARTLFPSVFQLKLDAANIFYGYGGLKKGVTVGSAIPEFSNYAIGIATIPDRNAMEQACDDLSLRAFRPSYYQQGVFAKVCIYTMTGIALNPRSKSYDLVMRKLFDEGYTSSTLFGADILTPEERAEYNKVYLDWAESKQQYDKKLSDFEEYNKAKTKNRTSKKDSKPTLEFEERPKQGGGHMQDSQVLKLLEERKREFSLDPEDPSTITLWDNPWEEQARRLQCCLDFLNCSCTDYMSVQEQFCKVCKVSNNLGLAYAPQQGLTAWSSWGDICTTTWVSKTFAEFEKSSDLFCEVEMLGCFVALYSYLFSVNQLRCPALRTDFNALFLQNGDKRIDRKLWPLYNYFRNCDCHQLLVTEEDKVVLERIVYTFSSIYECNSYLNYCQNYKGNLTLFKSALLLLCGRALDATNAHIKGPRVLEV